MKLKHLNPIRAVKKTGKKVARKAAYEIVKAGEKEDNRLMLEEQRKAEKKARKKSKKKDKNNTAMPNLSAVLKFPGDVDWTVRLPFAGFSYEIESKCFLIFNETDEEPIATVLLDDSVDNLLIKSFVDGLLREAERIVRDASAATAEPAPEEEEVEDAEDTDEGDEGEDEEYL